MWPGTGGDRLRLRVSRAWVKRPAYHEESPVDETHREPEINKLFRTASKHVASDLHLKVGQPPMMRLRGNIHRVDMRPLTQEDMDRLIQPILYAEQTRLLSEGRKLPSPIRSRKERCSRWW